MNAVESDLIHPATPLRKPRVLLVDTGQESFAGMQEGLKGAAAFHLEAARSEAALHRGKGDAPDLVVLDIGGFGAAEQELLTGLRASFGEVPVIIVSEALEDAQVRKLMKQRVHDWMRKPVVPGDLQAAIQGGVRIVRQSTSRVHAVVSAAPGAGGSTVAVSLADLLARKHDATRAGVALVDLDFSTGSCGYLLNMTNGYNLDSVASAPSRIDAEFASLIQLRHPNGFSVYSFKRRNLVTHLNCYELVLRLLDVVTAQQAHTVIDIPYYETDWRQDVLAAVNTVTVVCELNLPSIKQALDVLASLRELPVPRQQVHVLINKRQGGLFTRQRIADAKIRQILEDTPYSYLPADEDSLGEAMDRGIVLSEANPSSRFLKALGKFTEKTLLAGAKAPA